jgi:predicted NBD/HSP70 family sugar kinase
MKNISGNALIIKEININLVRKTLKSKGTATKQQIAEETGLSLVTVGTVLQHLVGQHEVFESELSPSSGGRPAQQYRYNDDFAFALIIFPYESDENIIIRSTIVNLSGQCINSTDSQVEAIDLKTFERIIEPLFNTYPSIQAIGFGHPGVEESGKIIVSDYKMLVGTTFTEHFSSLYHVPVIIENDVNAAVVGFASQKKLPHNSILVYLYFPDQHPPGAGILINGELFKGMRGFAGEVSTIPLDLVWDDELYSSFETLCEAITKLIMTVCAILNPDKVILNGNFLSEKHMATISQNCNTALPQIIIPAIQLSDSFVSDYQKGLIVQTLKQLETDIKITSKKHLEA